MTYNISDRLDKYTQTSEYKEHEFHFGIYIALTSLAGTIIFIFSNTAIWITPLNMAVASFLILLTGIYKKKDKRTFLLFYTHGTQKKEIVKNLLFGIILLSFELLITKIYYILNIFIQKHFKSDDNVFLWVITTLSSFILYFIFTFFTLIALTMAISFFVKPIALIIVKKTMEYRKKTQ